MGYLHVCLSAHVSIKCPPLYKYFLHTCENCSLQQISINSTYITSFCVCTLFTSIFDPQGLSKRGKRKDPEGLKLYVGNLPFKATEEQLKAIFEGVATVNELVMATDNAGKPKGFAFAFVKETDQGEAIVAKLNGTELLGRKIKV